MPVDIHSKEFDEGTQVKLSILNNYLHEWIPVFTAKRQTFWKKIYIYDFFAGEGKDAAGNYGSPLIILDALRKHCNDIASKQLYVKVVLNDYNKKKTKKLTQVCENFMVDCQAGLNKEILCPRTNPDAPCVFNLAIENNDFQDFFSSAYSNMIKHPQLPRFMFLDQYGIKHVTEDIFSKLVSLGRTDFMFFISSSFVNRFVEIPEFKAYLSISREEFVQHKPYHCHRVIYNYYKSLLPQDKQFYIAPFSIKKGSNIYGLIFGTNHTLGVEKFLNVCWKLNEQTGEANFDIDNEKIDPMSPKLFADQDKPTKITYFERKLREKIESSELVTNYDVYNFTFEMGMLPKHANVICKEMQKTGKISNDVEFVAQNVHRLKNRRLKNE